ncbi:hypothetical protein [Paenibacillus aestuarii]|uniref:Uncharacterized protein n=1 Tax=Paenibacillus aestuarii TaxID=516965 RepID=A0ABW0K812_9BACL|nr:hypothetical protein [Paenibacillus aestuarii]
MPRRASNPSMQMMRVRGLYVAMTLASPRLQCSSFFIFLGTGKWWMWRE